MSSLLLFAIAAFETRLSRGRDSLKREFLIKWTMPLRWHERDKGDKRTEEKLKDCTLFVQLASTQPSAIPMVRALASVRAQRYLTYKGKSH